MKKEELLNLSDYYHQEKLKLEIFSNGLQSEIVAFINRKYRDVVGKMVNYDGKLYEVIKIIPESYQTTGFRFDSSDEFDSQRELFFTCFLIEATPSGSFQQNKKAIEIREKSKAKDFARWNYASYITTFRAVSSYEFEIVKQAELAS